MLYKWADEMFDALDTHLQAPAVRGQTPTYGALENVYKATSGIVDRLEPSFVGGTLVLFLAALDINHDVLGLDRAVLNSKGQPLPIHQYH